jgi:hypothetical protein
MVDIRAFQQSDGQPFDCLLTEAAKSDVMQINLALCASKPRPERFGVLSFLGHAFMSTYVTPWDEHVQRATTFVHTDTAQAKVTYQGDNGSKFRVLVTQKPNPIGFRAQLPGDRQRYR